MLCKRHLTWNQKSCARLEACSNRINWSWCRGEMVCWNMFHSQAEEVSKIQLHKSENRWLKPFLDLYRAVGHWTSCATQAFQRMDIMVMYFLALYCFCIKCMLVLNHICFCWYFLMNLIYFLFKCVFHVKHYLSYSHTNVILVEQGTYQNLHERAPKLHFCCINI